MLYQFLLHFIDSFSFLNVFKYLTFRTGLSFFTSLVIVLIIGGPFIKFFSRQKILNPIRDDGPEDHIVKKIGTPTMGGVLILIGLSTALYEYVEAARNFLPMIERMSDMSVDVKKIYARFQFYNSDDFMLWHLTACIWFTIVSGLAWTNKMIPKYLVILGLLLGLSNGVAFIGIIKVSATFDTISCIQ